METANGQSPFFVNSAVLRKQPHLYIYRQEATPC